MSENEKVTVQDVLEFTLKDISSIQVPAAYLDEIGPPIARALKNLKACIEALHQKKDDSETENQNGS